MLKSKPLILLPVILLIGCTVTGPADDGYENSNEWVDNGRLFADDMKRVYLSGDQQKREAVEDPAANTKTERWLDYDAYQQWKLAKDNNSLEYQKFKRWQEFETYQRWKEQQPSE